MKVWVAQVWHATYGEVLNVFIYDDFNTACVITATMVAQQGSRDENERTWTITEGLLS